MYRIFKTFDEFEQLSGVWECSQVFEKVSYEDKDAFVTENLCFAMVIFLPKDAVEENVIVVKGTEKETSSLLYSLRGDDEVYKRVCVPDVKIDVKFFDYGPIEKESATVGEYIEHCFDGVVLKKDCFGYEILNEAEKKLLDRKDYISLLTNRDFLKYTDTEVIENARKDIPDGTPLATAIDEYLKENCGLKGRNNRRKLKKAIEKHIADEFDGDFLVSLCKDAVKDYDSLFYVRCEKYSEIKSKVTKFLEDKGFSGEYPIFKREDCYVNFGVCIDNDEWELYVRFGTSGESRKKYNNYATGAEILIIPCLNCEGDGDKIEMCLTEVVNILEKKPVSKEFREMTSQAALFRTDRNLGIFCIILALLNFALLMTLAVADPLGFVNYFTDGVSQILGIVLSIFLFVHGVLLLTSNGRGRYLISDKGEKI